LPPSAESPAAGLYRSGLPSRRPPPFDRLIEDGQRRSPSWLRSARWTWSPRGTERAGSWTTSPSTARLYVARKRRVAPCYVRRREHPVNVELDVVLGPAAVPLPGVHGVAHGLRHSGHPVQRPGSGAPTNAQFRTALAIAAT